MKEFKKKNSPPPPAPPAPPRPAPLAVPAPPTLPPPPPAAARTQPKYEDLPIVSVFDKKDMKQSIELMSEDIELQRQQDATKDRRSEIKTLLVAIAKRHKVPGMRHGRVAVYYNGEKTKFTLDRSLLLENGVTPQQIKDSLKESAPYVDMRVVDLDKPKKGKGDGGGGEDD